MELRKKIHEDLKNALKNKEESKLSALRLLWDGTIKKEKEKRAALSAKIEKVKDLEEESQLTDEEIVQLISSSIKRSKEAILQFEQGKREDLVQKEKQEIEFIEKYLPEQLSEDEVRKIAQEAVEKTKAQSLKDMGKVMGVLMPKIKGRADGNMVSQIVKELLS